MSKHGCHLAKQYFEQDMPDATPRLSNKQVSLEDATREAAKILKRSKQALIGGLGTDVNGMRAALRLAEKASAVIDHMHSDAAFSNFHVLQTDGWITTTLAEIKNRADLVIFAGTDANTNYPRFFERILQPEDSLFNQDKQQRQFVYIGDDLDTSAAKQVAGHKSMTIQCQRSNLGEIISCLHTVVAGSPLKGPLPDNVRSSELEKLTELIKAASYGVIIWAPAELDQPHGELTVQSICELVRYLNQDSRFAGLSLGGSEGGMTASQVMAWQCGYPSRLSFANGYPEFDPHRFSARRLLNTNAIDALLWISSYSAPVDFERPDCPSIVMAAPSIPLNFEPDVYIPVGIPGLNHNGQIIRTDGVVSFRLKHLQDSVHPAAATVLQQIYEQYR